MLRELEYHAPDGRYSGSISDENRLFYAFIFSGKSISTDIIEMVCS